MKEGLQLAFPYLTLLYWWIESSFLSYFTALQRCNTTLQTYLVLLIRPLVAAFVGLNIGWDVSRYPGA